MDCSFHPVGIDLCQAHVEIKGFDSARRPRVEVFYGKLVQTVIFASGAEGAKGLG
jgi:hypothetical protein